MGNLLVKHFFPNMIQIMLHIKTNFFISFLAKITSTFDEEKDYFTFIYFENLSFFLLNPFFYSRYYLCFHFSLNHHNQILSIIFTLILYFVFCMRKVIIEAYHNFSIYLFLNLIEVLILFC